MALIFMDGFDYYEPSGAGVFGGPMDRHWLFTGSTGSIQPGRHNADFSNNLGFATGSNTHNSPYIGDYATMIVGFVFNIPVTNTNQRIFLFYDTGTIQCSLYTDGNGVLSFYRGDASVLLASGTTSIFKNIWYHCQIKVTFDNTTGSVQVKLNELDEIHSGGGPVTGLDTQVSSNASANKIGVSGGSFRSVEYDDLWVLNDTPSASGPPLDDFLGDIMIETLFADGDGAINDWTPLSGNNWENVDEHATDDDTSYVFTNTPSFIDLYSFDDLAQITNAGTISAIQVDLMTKKTAAGGRNVRPIIRHDAVNYDGSTMFVTDDYGEQLEFFPANPGTSLGWTISEINAAEFGIELVS